MTRETAMERLDERDLDVDGSQVVAAAARAGHGPPREFTDHHDG